MAPKLEWASVSPEGFTLTPIVRPPPQVLILWGEGKAGEFAFLTSSEVTLSC